mgnify:CR=1 FL=1
MQPTLCSRCKKRVAVVFISKLENGKTVNEGLCLKCAKDLGLPQVNDMMRRMGITDDDLEAINDEMMQAFGGAESMEGLIPQGDDEADGDEEDGKTATFPFLNRLFNNGETTPAPNRRAARRHGSRSRAGRHGPRRRTPRHCTPPGRRAGRMRHGRPPAPRRRPFRDLRSRPARRAARCRV